MKWDTEDLESEYWRPGLRTKEQKQKKKETEYVTVKEEGISNEGERKGLGKQMMVRWSW